MDDELYAGREQTLVKHEIIKHYLLRFALIIGSYRRSITYIDCFSGPWKSQSESYDDTSFGIAIRELRAAREELAKKGQNVELRAFFIERDRRAYRELATYAGSVTDVEVVTRNSNLEDSVSHICDFVAKAPKTFPFILIDPTGWNGFALDVIKPLLQLNPCEVLINFMTQHIVRFAELDDVRASFDGLYGGSSFRTALRGKVGEDRNDSAVFEYRNAVANAGQFAFPGVAAVLNPTKSRSHFHMIYLTRNAKGLEVFKDAEKRSMNSMEVARSVAQQRARTAKSGQGELFLTETPYFDSLRARYLELAETELLGRLSGNSSISYDDAWRTWLGFPMVQESDLKAFIKNSAIQVEGLKKGKRVPSLKQGIQLRLRTGSE